MTLLGDELLEEKVWLFSNESVGTSEQWSTSEEQSLLPEISFSKPKLNSFKVSFLSRNGSCKGALHLAENKTSDLENTPVAAEIFWLPSRDEHEASDAYCTRNQFKVSISEVLTLRLKLEEEEPSATIHLLGGKLFGLFRFADGPKAASAFLSAMLSFVDIATLKDGFNPGELFAVEPRQQIYKFILEESESILSDETGVSSELLNKSACKGRKDKNKNGTHNQLRTPGTLFPNFQTISLIAGITGARVSSILCKRGRLRRRLRNEEKRENQTITASDSETQISSFCNYAKLPLRQNCSKMYKRVPVSEAVWEEFFDEQGRILDPVVLKQAIFRGGVEECLRARVWPFLLGVYGWDSTARQRKHTLQTLKEDYEVLKKRWIHLLLCAKAEDRKSLSSHPNALNVQRRERLCKASVDCLEAEERIAKDIVRTDRKIGLYLQDRAPATELMGTILNVYATYNTQILYCQGMSEFLSPLIFVFGLGDDAFVFWSFVGLMSRVGGNFSIDEVSMKSQLSKLKRLVSLEDEALFSRIEEVDPEFHSCFRWILLQFKREFTFKATIDIWEVIWAQTTGNDLQIFLAASLLLMHREEIMLILRNGFDCLLRFIHNLGKKLNIENALRCAHLYNRKYHTLINRS